MADELVTSRQAAEILGVGIRQFQKMVRGGILQPQASRVHSTKMNRMFLYADVAALKDLREQHVSFPAVVLESRRSAIEARAIRRELSQLKACLGLNIPSLPIERDAIISCLLRAEDALREQLVPHRREVLYWAQIFHAVSEEHFKAIKLYTSVKEPWKTWVNLARKLCAEQPYAMTRVDEDLNQIYQLLHRGLRLVRQAAYFYVREEHGNMIAKEMFPEVKGCPHEEVIALAFPESMA